MFKKERLALISRFVVDINGKKIGESISLFGDMLIIKKEDGYYAIPLKHVERRGEEIHLKGVIQWDRAEELAKEWMKEWARE